MLRRYLTILGFAIIYSCGQISAASGNDEVQVWTYFPEIKAGSYLPETIESIGKKHCHFGADASESPFHRLRDALERGDRATFDKELVRVKVSGLATGDLYVDVNGSLLVAGNIYQESSLTPDEFSDFRVELIDLAEKMGCVDDSVPLVTIDSDGIHILDQENEVEDGEEDEEDN